MKLFDIDIRKLGVLLLPTFLRKHKWIAWVRTLLTPIDSLHSDFLKKRNEDLYKLEHNGQVCYLRDALNDKFDKELRRIEIGDGFRYGKQYIFTQAENKPVYLGKIYIRPRDEYKGGADFIVIVPNELLTRELEIKALVDYYRLAGKKYKIIPK